MPSLGNLQQSELFQSVSATVLEELRKRARRMSYRRGDVIVREGESGDAFYFVLSGQLAVYRETAQGQREFLDFYSEGSFFGEMALLFREPRSASVEGLVNGSLLCIEAEDFYWLLGAEPQWAAELRQIARERRSQAQMPGEVELVFARRHPYALVETLLLPSLVALVIILALIAVVWRGLLSSQFALAFFSLSGIALTLWFVYLYEDWRNDNFLVTTQRIVHVERVPLTSGEQSEALIWDVRGVSTDTPTLGARLFGFKDIVIQTGTTLETIRFSGLANAEEVSRIIANARDRVQAQFSFQEKQEKLRAHLDQRRAGPDSEGAIAPGVGTADGRGSPSRSLSDYSQIVGGRVAGYFIPRMRRVEGNRTIWQRHWYVLFRLTVLPVLVNALLVLLMMWVILGGSVPLDIRPAQAVWILLVLLLAALVWLFWQYEDWHNDYYVLTDSEIIDRISLPLGFQEKAQSVSLGSVQNVRADTPGVIYKLLRMGYVYIDTIGGTEPVTFDSVMNPFDIQAEVRRRQGNIRQRERQQQASEFGEWFAAYHEILGRGDLPVDQTESP